MKSKLVVGPKLISPFGADINTPSFSSCYSSVDWTAEEIIHLLLYFDEFSFIPTNTVHDFYDQICMFGIAKKEYWEYDTSDIDTTAIDAHLRDYDKWKGYQLPVYMAYKQLEKENEKQPGEWTLTIMAPKLPVYEDKSTVSSIYFRFVDLLPSSKAVPYAEVLDFKQKRHDELNDLRYCIGELYQSCIQSGDRSHAFSLCAYRLRCKINDLEKLIGERAWQKIRKDVQIQFNITGGTILEAIKDGMIIGGVINFALTELVPAVVSIGLPIAVGAASILARSIVFAVQDFPRPSKVQNLTGDFAYIIEANRSLSAVDFARPVV